jgi:hypothetical protein
VVKEPEITHTFDHHFQQKKLGFLLNLGVHLKLPNKIKGRPHLKKGEPDLKGPNQLLHNKKKPLEGS